MQKQPKNLVAALAYAKIGWKVFAIRYKSKAPLTLHGFHDATSCEYILRRWWETDPACGVGIATGAKSGILVLDVDLKGDGPASLAALEEQHGPLPLTIEAATGGGGRHLIFALPEGVWPCAVGLWPGLDVRADGGYIVAPFAVHPSGKEYLWVDGRGPEVPGHEGSGIFPAPAPEWLLEALKTKKRERVAQSRKEMGDNPGKVGEGSRNNFLASRAGTMRRSGFDYSVILAALLAENMLKCDPPLSEHEVQVIAESISRYSPADEDDDLPPPLETCGDEEEEDNNPVKLADADNMGYEQEPQVSWLMEGWIARGDCVLLYGPPGSSKSWITLEIALTTACGLPTFGTFDRHGEALKVLVVDEENPPEEQWRRLNRLVKAWQVPRGTYDNQLYLSRACQGFTFKRKEYIQGLHKRMVELKPDLVILDSITALSTIRNEADAIEVRSFFHDQLYALRNIHPCAIILVHHSNKAVYQVEQPTSDSGAARGSIDFLGAADSVLMVKPGNQGRTLVKPIKIRRGKMPSPFEFTLTDTDDGGVRPIIYQPALSLRDCVLALLRKGPRTTEDFRRELFAQNIKVLGSSSLKVTLHRLIEEGVVISSALPGDGKRRLYQLKLVAPAQKLVTDSEEDSL